MKYVDPFYTYRVANPVNSKEAWEFLKSGKIVWFNPLPSQVYPEHYMTFMKMTQLDEFALPIGTAI